MTLICHDHGAGLPDEVQEGTLLYLLSNHLLLCQTVPYLSVSAILNLAATSRAFHRVIYSTPHVFRHLDLSQVKSAQFDIGPIDQGGETWRNVQLDESVTEDEYVFPDRIAVLPQRRSPKQMY